MRERHRDGAWPTTTSSENTTAVRFDAGAKLVFLADKLFLADERRFFIGVLPNEQILTINRRPESTSDYRQTGAGASLREAAGLQTPGMSLATG
jgi:hypothetical protein